MSTRSSAKNLFPPIDNPELTIRRRSHTDPTLLNDSKMAAEGHGDLPDPDLRTMEELCQPSLNGRNSYQFHGLPGDDANKHLDKFLHVTHNIKVNGVTAEALHLYLFPHSLTHHATAWFDRLLRNSISTFKKMAKMFLGKYFPPSMVTKLRNEITNFRQHLDESLFKAWVRYKLSIDRCPNHNMLPVTQIDTFYNGLTLRHRDIINAAAGGTFMKRRPKECYELIENMTAHHNDWDTSAQRTLVGYTQNVYAARAYQGNTINNPKEDLKGITTRSGTTYQGPTIPTTTSSSSSSSLVVERKTEATKDTVHPTSNESTEDVLHPCVQTKSPILNSEPIVASIIEPVASPVKLADRLISRPVGVAEDVFVKVGTFHFSADFVVVDFDADPRVPLIIGRSFLKTGTALIDVFEGELTLRVGKEAITFNLDQTLRYSANYNDMTTNRIDVIDMACEEYSQEFLGFSNVTVCSNPTPYYDLIVSTTSPTLTPFGESDFLLEEVDAFLTLKDDPNLPKVGHSFVDIKGDILLLEAFLNDDPSLPPPNQGNYLPQDLPPYLEYEFLEGDDKFPVIIAKDFSVEEKTALITRRVNPKIHDVLKNEVLKLLDVGLIYPISDNPWVSPVHCIPKKGSFTVAENKENELILTRLVMGWRVCIDYCKLNEATRENHFPLPFMDQMLERLAGNQYYCFFDGLSGYFQIPIDPKDQEKTTFTCPYGTFAYRRMPFGLCKAPGTFQRCMMAIVHDMIEKTMEVFMDDFLVFRNSFQTCLSHLEKMLKRCEDTNLCLNWEKSHFMIKEGIVLSHKISKNGTEVDKAKVDVIAKLHHPITVKGISSFLGHAGFYRRFIQDFSKIARPMTRLLEKDTLFLFSKECVEAFQTLKRKLNEAPILIAPNWDMPFELMCDASDFAIGAVLGKRQEKHFRPIHYASKTMTEASQQKKKC
nr:reverse transcriptase domain-containing protein [Tanacetum cinerariifolium]